MESYYYVPFHLYVKYKRFLIIAFTVLGFVTLATYLKRYVFNLFIDCTKMWLPNTEELLEILKDFNTRRTDIWKQKSPPPPDLPNLDPRMYIFTKSFFPLATILWVNSVKFSFLINQFKPSYAKIYRKEIHTLSE